MEISYLPAAETAGSRPTHTTIGKRHRKGIPMKIAVVAANGKEGRLIVKEALNRGHDVTAVVRGANTSDAPDVPTHKPATDCSQ